MISIIIPVYNQADKLGALLKSIALQSDQNFEVIIVDDGSKDNPEKVFGDFILSLRASGGLKGEGDYKFFKQENKGAPAARNHGFRESRGEYLFFCDADLTMDKTLLEKLRLTLEAHPEVSYVYSSFYFGRKLFKVGPFDANKMRKMPYINPMALLRREHFPVGGWDEGIKKFQDWDLWLTILEAGHQGIFVPEVLYHVQTGGTMSVWLPAIAYKLCPFLPAVKKYNSAMKIIKEKHRL
ncbi:MAG: glycosyltransferase family A protein [Candidatus Falkowbacteria bacterium]|nr:glycosyltransferase family A protein [Candidatus Falkowbacteria bacterium]